MGKKKKGKQTKGGASTRRVKGSYLQRHKPGHGPKGDPHKKDPPKQPGK